MFLQKNWSLYIKETICTYVPTFVPLSQANRQTNLHQILHRPPHQLREGSYHKYDPANLTPNLGVPQTPKPWQITQEKLCVT